MKNGRPVILFTTLLLSQNTQILNYFHLLKHCLKLQRKDGTLANIENKPSKPITRAVSKPEHVLFKLRNFLWLLLEDSMFLLKGFFFFERKREICQFSNCCNVRSLLLKLMVFERRLGCSGIRGSDSQQQPEMGVW